MMLLDKLVLFNRNGDTRPIELTAGALNVLTRRFAHDTLIHTPGLFLSGPAAIPLIVICQRAGARRVVAPWRRAPQRPGG